MPEKTDIAQSKHARLQGLEPISDSWTNLICDSSGVLRVKPDGGASSVNISATGNLATETTLVTAVTSLQLLDDVVHASGSQFNKGVAIVAFAGSSTAAHQIQAFELTGTIALKTALVDSAGNQIVSFGGGTQYSAGVTASVPVGTVAMAVGASQTIKNLQVIELSSNLALKIAVYNSSGDHISQFGTSQVTVTNIVGTVSAVITGSVVVTNTISAVITGSVVVTNTVSAVVTGTVTADTELPAAAALADNELNANAVPSVGARLMGFDGSTWDRVRVGAPGSDNVTPSSFPGVQCVSTLYAFDGTDMDRIRLEGSVLGLMVGGSIAHDSSESGNPISVGFNARQTNPTPVADADRVRGIADDIGRQVVILGHVQDLQEQNSIQVSSSAETDLFAGSATTVFNHLVSLDISNRSQFSTFVSIRDVSAGTVRLRYEIPPKGILVKTWPMATGFKQTTGGGSWTVQTNNTATVCYNVVVNKNV